MNENRTCHLYSEDYYNEYSYNKSWIKAHFVTNPLLLLLAKRGFLEPSSVKDDSHFSCMQGKRYFDAFELG